MSITKYFSVFDVCAKIERIFLYYKYFSRKFDIFHNFAANTTKYSIK